jgi:hypothetical protein
MTAGGVRLPAAGRPKGRELGEARPDDGPADGRQRRTVRAARRSVQWTLLRPEHPKREPRARRKPGAGRKPGVAG